MKKTVFLDTMIYLHYRPLEDIDFLSLLRSSKVVIIVPRITVQELDKQKDKNPSRRLKDRARKVLQKFEGWFAIEEAEISASTFIQYFGSIPNIDFASIGLDGLRGDDNLIATIIHYQKENPDEDVLLITQDTGPKLTAKDHDIATLSFQDDLKLQEEKDPLEKENLDLKRQIEKLTNALPKPRVHFISGQSKSNIIEVQLEDPLPYPKEEIESNIRALEEEYHFVGSSLSAVFPEEECKRYNSELQQFFESNKRFIERNTEIVNARRLELEIQLEILNEGTGPANDLDVKLRFPDNISVVRKKDHEKKKENLHEPNPPTPLRTETQMMLVRSIGSVGAFDSLTRSMAYTPPFLPNLRPVAATRHFEISEDGHEIYGEIQKLKHNDWWTLPELVMKFNDYESAKSFSIDYKIRVANLPDEIAGKLNIKVAKAS